METEISARTRVYDYLWANLPVLISRGDAIAEKLLGRTPKLVIEKYTEELVGDALLFAMQNPDVLDSYRREIGEMTMHMHWSKTVLPLA